MSPRTEARRLYRQGGISIRRIAHRYGVSVSTVWRWLNPPKAPPRREPGHFPPEPPPSPDVLAAILSRVAEQLRGRP